MLSWGQAVYPLWWPSQTKDMQTELLLRGGLTDTVSAYNIWFKTKIAMDNRL